MRNEVHIGKRCIALLRCSSKGQVDTSIDAQRVLIEQYAREHEMVLVDTVSLDGVSGSEPGTRSEHSELVQRKKERDDFDALLVHDVSRLTRVGPRHGMSLLNMLGEVGVEVISVTSDLPDSPISDIVRSLEFYAANTQARSIAQAATRGAVMSLSNQHRAHCLRPPYGIDRLYCAEDGTPKFIIRNEPDGTQLKLSPDGQTVLERFGRNAQSGTPAHYIKQKTERIELVPGAPERVAVVREIFERHFASGWGYRRIAKDLNDRGIPSATGKLWSNSAVRGILLNPAYCGAGMANIRSQAYYYVRGKDRPIELPHTSETTPGGRRPLLVRDRQHWVQCPAPHVADLLDESIRATATRRQEEYLDRVATRQPQPRHRDRHADSRFLLKGILTTCQGPYPMTGRIGGRNNEYRYYTVSRAYGTPRSADKPLCRLLRAEPLEALAVDVLEEVLRTWDGLPTAVRAAVRTALSETRIDSDARRALLAERDALDAKLSAVFSEFAPASLERLRPQLQQLEGRRKEIDRQLAASCPPDADADAIAAQVCADLRDLGTHLRTLPAPALRKVLKHLIERMEYDPETDTVVLQLALPAWVTTGHGAMGLDGSFACKAANETHHRILIQRHFRRVGTGRKSTWEPVDADVRDTAA
jgi:DNA invertase Pin-like site-specific DNA recombinase